MMANRSISPYFEAIANPRSPSMSPTPGRTPTPNRGNRPMKRKLKHPAQCGKSPYSLVIGARSYKPNHAVIGCRNWDWRPKSPDSVDFQKLPQLESVQKSRNESMQDDRHWDDTVTSYLEESKSVYALMSERQDLNAQVRWLSELVPRLEAEYEQADREAVERLSSKHETLLQEKQRQLSKFEADLHVTESELRIALAQIKDNDQAKNELRNHIADLKDFQGRSMETEKMMKAQIQDLAQRSARLEQELKESLESRNETDAQLRAAQNNLASHQAQHSNALQQQRDENAAERRRRDEQEADLRKENSDLWKELNTERVQTQEALQQANVTNAQSATERKWHQEQLQGSSAKYDKDTGDLRAEVQTEKSAALKLRSELADMNSERNAQEETIKMLNQGIAEDKTRKGADEEGQARYVEALSIIAEMEAKMKQEEQQCRAAKSEVQEQAHKISEFEKQCEQLGAMHQKAVDRAKVAEQEYQSALDAQKAVAQQQQANKDAAVSAAACEQQSKTETNAKANEQSRSAESVKEQVAEQESPRQANKLSSGVTEQVAAEESPRGVPAVSSEASKQPSQSSSLSPKNKNQPKETVAAPGPGSAKPIKKTEPIKKIEKFGCVFWQVVLKKIGDTTYGFTQISGKDWNLEHVDGPNHWIFKRVMDQGLLFQWNTEHPDAQVLPGDRIVAVNEKVSLQDMQEAQQGNEVKMTICRWPETFELTLEKNNQKLGFMFEKPGSEDLPEIRITKVLAEGALPAHNAKAVKNGHWHRVVLPQMSIVAVNGIEGDATRLSEELRVRETVELKVKRAQDLDKQFSKRQSIIGGLLGGSDTSLSKGDAASDPDTSPKRQQDQAYFW